MRTLVAHEPPVIELLPDREQVRTQIQGIYAKGQLAHRSAVVLADRLGRPVVEFPGDHAGFMALPEQCAQVLDQVLTQPT